MYADGMNKSYNTLIINLKELLRQKSWSQEKLGNKAGISQERISNLLNEKTEPTLLLVDKIADAFGISTVELLSEKSNNSIVREESTEYNVEQRGIIFTKYGKNSKVKNVTIHIPNSNKFRVDFVDFNFDKNSPESGKPNSYTNYMEYILQNYYDNFGIILDPYDLDTPRKLEKLRLSPNFKAYNLSESRFPNAAIEAYNRFIQSYK